MGSHNHFDASGEAQGRYYQEICISCQKKKIVNFDILEEMETPEEDWENFEHLNKAKTVHPIQLQLMLSDTKLDRTFMRRTKLLYQKAHLLSSDKVDSSDSLDVHFNLGAEELSIGSSDSEEEFLLIDSKWDDEKPLSIFNTWEKYVIALLGGLAGFWLSISSPIFVPVLSEIQNTFHVSESLVNITIVVYSIFQGVGPLVFSNLADTVGRRPIVIACLISYIVANCLLAVNQTFGGLTALRCVQAFCISSTISIGSGIASDITTRAERASFIGLTTGLALLGQAFGAFVGGMISSAFGWRAIFWFLAMSSGITLIVIFMLLPETASSIVGPQASGQPKRFRRLMVAPVMRLEYFAKRLEPVPFEEKTLEPGHKTKFNILKPLEILKQKEAILVLIPASLCYSLWLMMLTTLSHALTKQYGYSLDRVALSYIPCGMGGLIGSLSVGRILDYSYHRHMLKSREEGTSFNVLNSRLIVSAIPSTLCVLSALLFAWTLHYSGPVFLGIIASCIISYGAMCWLTISSTVIVDLRPTEASGSCAVVNLTRCWCAAGFVSVLSQMENMGIGWCYTLMASICGLSSLCVAYLYTHNDD